MKKELLIESIKELGKRISENKETFTKQSLKQLSDLNKELKSFKKSIVKNTPNMEVKERESFKGTLNIVMDFLEIEIETRGLNEIGNILEVASSEKSKVKKPRNKKAEKVEKVEPKKEESKKSKNNKVAKDVKKEEPKKEGTKKEEPKKEKSVKVNKLKDFSTLKVGDKFKLTYNDSRFAIQDLKVVYKNKEYITFECFESENGTEDYGKLHQYHIEEYNKGYKSVRTYIEQDDKTKNIRYILNAIK